jgi:2-oxoacid:acceptor oxidoreductase delta subunit (pyruvate/2-ketoisovalerate family)
MVVPYASAGSSVKQITGKWKAKKPVVNKRKCIKCGVCQDVCPDGIIDAEKKFPVIELDYCKGCSSCAMNCPVKAIKMVRVEHDA